MYFPQLGEAWFFCYLAPLGRASYKAGFLVCVPMLEEWRSGDGIEVLDGWTFQVSPIFTDQITGPHIFAYSVLIRVSTRIPRNDRMSIIDLFPH